MLFMKSPFIILLVFGSLQGCATVKQPIAKHPLVEQSYSQDYEMVSKDSWVLLNQNESGDTIKLNAQDVRLGRLFFSATGQQCRKVFLQQELTRVVCQDETSEQWRFIKPVISEYVEQ
jgi:hypothetical protein